RVGKCQPRGTQPGNHHHRNDEQAGRLRTPEAYMLGHLSLPFALRGDLLDPASPTGQAEQPRSPLRYVSCGTGMGADRSARGCKWAVPGALPGLWRRTSGEPQNAAAAPGRRRYKTPAHARSDTTADILDG